jgi:DNA polymerase-1
LKVHFNFDINSVDFDTLPAHPLLAGKVSHSLERMSIDYLNADSYKSILRDGRQFADIPLGEMADMNMDDCLYNLELAEIFEKELKSTNQLEYYRENVLRPISVFKNMEVSGVKVDMDYLEKLKKKLEDGIAECLEKLSSYKEIKGENWGKPIEKVLASNKDLNTILFSKFGLPPPRKQNTLGYSVDKQVLKELEIKYQDRSPFIKDLLEWKGLVKKLNTYVTPYYEKGHIKSDGKIHGNIRQDVALTGRLSMEKPNLQNIPVKDGPDILRLFISSYPGGKLVLADFSQIELRVIGAMSRDRKMIEAFMQNRDIHLSTAANVNRIPYETALRQYNDKDAQIKRMRDEAKSINFGILYGQQEKGLAELLGWYAGEGEDRKLDIQRAKTFIDEYFVIYDGVKDYVDKMKSDWRKYGYVVTPFGRRIIIKKSDKRHINEKNERRAVNGPIQGAASDICVIALCDLDEKFKREGLITPPVLTIHDALVFDSPPEEVEIVQILAKKIMEGLEFPWMINIPLKVDVSVGNNLAEAKG